MEATDIPIFIGASRPIVRKLSVDYFFGNDSFGEKPDREPVWNPEKDLEPILDRGNAVQEIIRLAWKHQGHFLLLIFYHLI